MRFSSTCKCKRFNIIFRLRYCGEFYININTVLLLAKPRILVQFLVGIPNNISTSPEYLIVFTFGHQETFFFLFRVVTRCVFASSVIRHSPCGLPNRQFHYQSMHAGFFLLSFIQSSLDTLLLARMQRRTSNVFEEALYSAGYSLLWHDT